MTLQERFIDQIAKTFANCLGTLKAKNNDYTKNSASDPFRNFRKSGEFARVDIDQSLLVRISDKLSRLESLTEPGFTTQIDEPLEDTLRDLINYFAILKAWYEMGQPEPDEPESVPIAIVATQGVTAQTTSQKITDFFKKK